MRKKTLILWFVPIVLFCGLCYFGLTLVMHVYRFDLARAFPELKLFGEFESHIRGQGFLLSYLTSGPLIIEMDKNRNFRIPESQFVYVEGIEQAPEESTYSGIILGESFSRESDGETAGVKVTAYIGTGLESRWSRRIKLAGIENTGSSRAKKVLEDYCTYGMKCFTVKYIYRFDFSENGAAIAEQAKKYCEVNKSSCPGHIGNMAFRYNVRVNIYTISHFGGIGIPIVVKNKIRK